MTRTIVISAVNFFDAGPLSIIKDCLLNIEQRNHNKQYRVIALVSRKELFASLELKNVEFFEFPESRTSYIKRLNLEFRKFASFAKEHKVDLWFSLHDITPNLPDSCRHVVYFQNPTPFYKISLREFLVDTTIGSFSLWYKYLYRINVHRNNFIVVQQQWIRNEIVSMFKLDPRRVIVAHPVTTNGLPVTPVPTGNEPKLFFFPTFPRVFKNIEILGEAARILVSSGITNFRIMVTITGNENRYASDIKSKYAGVRQLELIGRQDRHHVFSLYAQVDAMIFPSKLETWGLPISEFKTTGKPIFLSDLPYAHETLSEYNAAYFFDPLSPQSLADAIAKMIKGENIFHKHSQPPIADPYARNWDELFDLILKD